MQYKIAEICIEMREDEPMFWVYNIGYHPGQGGSEFVYGNFGTQDIERALDLLKRNLVRDLDIILEEVRKKNDKT